MDSTGIPIEPIASALMPYLVDITTVLVGAGVTWWSANYHRWTGKEMAQADKDTLAKAVNDAAGVIFAGAEAGISTQSIHPGDPRIANQANRVAVIIPDILTKLGLTPDGVAHAIAGKLGALQAASQTAPPAAVIVSAPSDAKLLAAPEK